jgi:cytochrome P450
MKALRTSSTGGKESSSELDADFMDNAIAQLKSFLFAGHDTTSSTLCFIYYHLWRTPDAMKRVRREHDEVFGSDHSQAADMIKRDPSLLNRLPFSTAVIKEVLRLHPAVGSVRAGAPGLFLVNPSTGRQFPTEGFLLHSVSHALQRNERYWQSPDQFLPERWLCREGDPLYPVKNAFRPFELGPRNCIGQELAQTELRLLLVLILRELDIVPEFPEDAAKVFGEVMYQANAPGQIVAHPRDGMPVRVYLRAAENIS